MDARPPAGGRTRRMLKDGELVCDRCQSKITRITSAPAEGWERMHNLCSNCFLEVWKESIPPA